VFVCDDVAETRSLTRAGLEEDPELRVVGEASDGQHAIAGVAELRPDVVLLDLAMPGLDGLAAIPDIRARSPKVGIVVFSGLAPESMMGPALERGADRYVEKGQPIEVVRRAIREVGGRKAPAGAPEGAEVGLAPARVDLQEFASAASHDLAEPLRVIAGFANLLARRYKGKLDEDGDKYIEAIRSGAERMQAMIDALLLYAEVGQAEAVRTLVNSNELVRGVVDGLHESLGDGEAKIDIGELPVVAAEASLLGQLFQNLLSNSMKFRSQRPLRVEVGAERGDDEWCFSVSDSGVGIDPSERERVFEMFRRLTTHDRPGTGVGLAICKRIVERHGGRIWMEPRTGGGSVFRFTIKDPATPPAPPR
jgi:light-regulated signal transduction histidine kinase (bacteriophytochrome)